MATKAYKAKLQYSTDNATWTTVARVKNIKPPKPTAKNIDVTVLDSADEYEESLPGLANGGELEATVEYSQTQTAALFSQFRTVQYWRIFYFDNSGHSGQGYVDQIGDQQVVNGEVIHTDVKIHATGKWTIAGPVS